jgi:hypothetical protein
MNYTDQEIDDIAAALRANREGKPVEERKSGGNWRILKGAIVVNEAGWRYRPVPEPILRPWRAEDVPPVCWVRFNNAAKEFHYMVVAVTPLGMQLIGSAPRNVPWVEMNIIEWSPDRSEGSWKPCTTTEP